MLSNNAHFLTGIKVRTMELLVTFSYSKVFFLLVFLSTICKRFV